MQLDAYEEIVRYLHQEQGCKLERLTPNARILQDLGVDGDDAGDLLEHLHREFGTDFSGIEKWTTYFNHEGYSMRGGCLGMVVSMSAAAALAIAITTKFDLRDAWGYVITLTIWVAIAVVLSRIFPDTHEPITIAELAAAAEAGAWPRRSTHRI